MRAQSPAVRAKEAVQALAVTDVPASDVRRRRLLDRLATGETNGTTNHHQIATILRFTSGGRATFIGHLERAMRNGDPDARAWWMVYGELLPSQQQRCDLDDVCEAAGVPPDRIMAIAVSSAMRVGADAADYVAAVMHPKIVHQTAKSAMRIGGSHAAIAQKDREMMLQHSKFLPVKGVGTSVTVNNTAQAAAHAAAASQPSVPTFAESLRGPMSAQREVQRQIAATAPIDADVVEAE